jgi:hypothetical protein
MGHTYFVTGGQGAPTPGAIGPAELDARAEWVPLPARGDLLDELRGRLGSEVDLRKVVLSALCPLRTLLDGAPLGALLERLPFPLAREVLEGELNLNATVPPPTGVGDYLVEVARLLQHPPPRAAFYVRAVFGAAKAVLGPDGSEAVLGRLPVDLAEAWRSAR